MLEWDAATRTMRETMRKKSPKDDDNSATNPSDGNPPSPSTESVGTNPWADAQSSLEPVSRSTSKTSQSPGPSVLTISKPASAPVPALSDAPIVTSPTVRDASQTSAEKPKKKKSSSKRSSTGQSTVANPPLTPVKEATIPERPKTSVASSTTNGAAKVQTIQPPAPPKLGFCKLPISIDIEPIKAKSKAKNPFVPVHTRQASSISSPSQPTPTTPSVTTSRFIAPSFTVETHADFFKGKIFVITNGASLVGASIVKTLHRLSARVIMGDIDIDKSKKLIKSIGEPHLVHYNKCDTRRYEDIVDLFKLASTMYGRVDHAIFGVGDDGAMTGTVGDGERGWFDRNTRPNVEGVEREPSSLVDTVGAPARFAHIALAYLRDKPKGKRNSTIAQDKSLTFLTSAAAFKDTPYLPIYQMTAHSVLGLLRSLRSSISPEQDGIRINAVMSGVMVPRATSGAGGRMSVKLPGDNPIDIGRAVVGVVAAGIGEKTIVTRAGGRLHGRALYMVGSEGYDIEEGLGNSENLWLGPKAAEHLFHAQDGVGKGSQWIMDLG